MKKKACPCPLHVHVHVWRIVLVRIPEACQTGVVAAAAVRELQLMSGRHLLIALMRHRDRAAASSPPNSHPGLLLACQTGISAMLDVHVCSPPVVPSPCSPYVLYPLRHAHSSS